MHFVVYLPLICALIFAAVGPQLCLRTARPVVGLWALTIGAAGSALASTWSLVLLVGTLLGDLSDAPDGRMAGARDQVNDDVAWIALGLVLLGAIRLGVTMISRARHYRELRQTCRLGEDQVVIVADSAPLAVAVPGAGGRIVVSRGMLTALTPDELRVLFAHERAHLRGAHHRHAGIVAAAIALNPLLGEARTACVHLCERSADEAAAAEVGDRSLAASSLARAALATREAQAERISTASPRHAALAYAECGVGARVVALQAAPSRARLGIVAAMSVVVGFALVSDVHATLDFLHLVLGTLRDGIG